LRMMPRQPRAPPIVGAPALFGVRHLPGDHRCDIRGFMPRRRGPIYLDRTRRRDDDDQIRPAPPSFEQQWNVEDRGAATGAAARARKRSPRREPGMDDALEPGQRVGLPSTAARRAARSSLCRAPCPERRRDRRSARPPAPAACGPWRRRRTPGCGRGETPPRRSIFPCRSPVRPTIFISRAGRRPQTRAIPRPHWGHAEHAANPVTA